MNIDEEELEKINQFAVNCDEMINGKFILSEIKIAKILKSIANSDALYGYFAECLLNFDFNKEFSKIKINTFTNSYIKMPNEDYKIVALVFCFLVEVDSKNIDFYDFVTTYFEQKDNCDSYSVFTKTMLVPFKNLILSHFGLLEMEEREKSEIEVNLRGQVIENTGIGEKIIKHIQSIQNVVEISPKIRDEQKQKLDIVLNAFIEAIKLHKKVILYALEVAMTELVKANKVIKPMYDDLLEMLLKFYNE